MCCKARLDAWLPDVSRLCVKVLHVPPAITHQAEALKDTFQLVIFKSAGQ